MEKTLEAANKSLLKKRKANQEGRLNVIQLLQSKIDNGEIRSARREALKHMVGKGVVSDIVELFKNAESKVLECQSCKRLTAKKFLIPFLMYDVNKKLCKDCKDKVTKAYEAQKTSEKIDAMLKFKENFGQLADGMIKLAGVPEIFKDASMNDIDPSTVKVLSADKSYFIKGDVGVGKSHMAVALMRLYLSKIKPEYDERNKEYFVKDFTDHIPCFIEVPELLLRIRNTYTNSDGGRYHAHGQETEKDIVEFYAKVPYLVLDDLGSEKASEFSTLMMYLIINRRCTSGKITVITSNLNLEEVSERLSDRIGSRIKGMCKDINVSGHDRRYKTARQQGSSEKKQH